MTRSIDQDLDTEEATLPCADKLSYGSLEQAAASAAYAEYSYDTRALGKPKPYKCRYCVSWHLSSRSAS
jgi:hypothetical protein